jgi:hypothetical protein
MANDKLWACELALSGVFCLGLLNCFHVYETAGDIEVEGTKMGTWKRPIGRRCTPGTDEAFLGADLYGNGFRLRVVEDPIKGPAVRLFQEASGLVFDGTPEVCSTLEVNVGRSLRSQWMGGWARFSCTPKTGGSIRGSVTFDCE